MSDIELEGLRKAINRWTKSINGIAATVNFLARVRDTPAHHLQALADLARVCKSSSCDVEVAKNIAYHYLSIVGSCCDFWFPPPYCHADDVAGFIADAASATAAASASAAAATDTVATAAAAPASLWSLRDRNMTEAEKANLARDMRCAVNSLRRRYYDMWDEVRAKHGALHAKSEILRLGYEAVLDVAVIVYHPTWIDD